MDKLIQLYNRLSDSGVKLFSWDLDEKKAITLEMNENYAIFMDFDNIESKREETVIAFHEAGHTATGATHKVCSPYDLVEKHEYKAWKWAIQNYFSENVLNNAFADGYTEIWSLAERFDVTPDFMRKAICWYTHGNLATDLYF